MSGAGLLVECSLTRAAATGRLEQSGETAATEALSEEVGTQTREQRIWNLNAQEQREI